MAVLSKLLKTVHKKKEPPPIKKCLTLVPHTPTSLTNEQRFKQYLTSSNTSCWEWSGAIDRYGYGKFQIEGKTVKAHRYSYELHYGPFDSKLHVLHHCDNPCCVNPDHLFLGTNLDNVADRTAKKREGNTSRRLTAQKKERIQMALQEGCRMSQLADDYGVHISTIKRLKNF